jgi:hypothetical protein
MNRRKFLLVSGGTISGGIGAKMYLDSQKQVAFAQVNPIESPGNQTLSSGNSINIPIKPFTIKGSGFSSADSLVVYYRLKSSEFTDIEVSENANIGDSFEVRTEGRTLTASSSKFSTSGTDTKIEIKIAVEDSSGTELASVSDQSQTFQVQVEDITVLDPVKTRVESQLLSFEQDVLQDGTSQIGPELLAYYVSGNTSSLDTSDGSSVTAITRDSDGRRQAEETVVYTSP